MKWFVRSFVFTTAFIIGVAFGVGTRSCGLCNCVVSFPPESKVGRNAPTAAPVPKGVSVLYAGLRHDSDKQLYLKFVIYNGLDQRISYSAHTPHSPYTTLTANGEKLRSSSSYGSGVREWYISAGNSAEVRVYPFDLLERPPKSKLITATFYLSKDHADGSETYTSQTFLLPGEFRKAIDSRGISKVE